MSDGKIRRLPNTHKRHERLKEKVTETEIKVEKAAEEKRQNLRMGLTYAQLLKGRFRCLRGMPQLVAVVKFEKL